MGHKYENLIKISWPDAPDDTPFKLNPTGKKNTSASKNQTYPLYERATGQKTGFSIKIDPNLSEVALITEGTEMQRRNYGGPYRVERLREMATEDLIVTPKNQPAFGPDYTIVPVDTNESDDKFNVAAFARTIYPSGLKLNPFRRARIALTDWLGGDSPDGVVRVYPLLPRDKSQPKGFGVVVRYGALRTHATIVDMQEGKPVGNPPTVVIHATREYGGGTKANVANAVVTRGIVAGPDGAPQWSPHLPTTRGRRTTPTVGH